MAWSVKARLDWVLFTFAILSFFHERPVLDVFGADRLNPRLFDIAGILIVLRILSVRHRYLRWRGPAARVWVLCVGWMTVCALASLWALPPEMGAYSLYYLWKYIIGAIVAIYLTGFVIEERAWGYLLFLLRAGGVYVGLYCIPQFIAGGATYELPNGDLVVLQKGILLGPLGPTYFHIALISPIATLASLAIAASRNGSRTFNWLSTAICAWPILFCGSRTALFLALAMIGVFLWHSGGKRRFQLIALTASLGAIFILSSSVVAEYGGSLTLERLASYGAAGGRNSGWQRLMVWQQLFSNDYVAGFMTWITGSGFYVSPIENGSIVRYRIGYGIHNTLLFAVEQGGVLLGLLFLAFLTIATKRAFFLMRRAKRNSSLYEYSVRLLGFCIVVAIVLSIPFGQVFWQGFGTENLNTLLLTLIFTSASPLISRAADESPYN